jgi:hypothetical protein
MGCAHIYQLIPVTVVMMDCPLESLEDELHALFEVQSAKIDPVYAICHQFPDHVDCKLDAVIFNQLIVVLHKDEVTATRVSPRSRTLILSRSARIEGGTEVPQSFVIRRKDA